MKIIKPNTLGLLQKAHTHKQKHYLTIVASAYFDLSATHLRRFLNDLDCLPRFLDALPDGMPPDDLMPKPNAEWLLVGSARQDIARPFAEVQVEVGSSKKKLLVVGDRTLSYDRLRRRSSTQPKPFLEMDLSYQHAFGGPTNESNPSGRGEQTGDLPNLIPHSDKLSNTVSASKKLNRRALRQLAHVKDVVALGPQSIAMAGRQQYAPKDAPESPHALTDDFDFRVFQAAAEDQWLPGTSLAGMPFKILGCGPSDEGISGKLPKHRVFAFVHHEGQSVDAVERIPLFPDTVWLITDHNLGLLTYRATIEIQHVDAGDVASVMVGYEAADEAERPLEHYHKVLNMREDRELSTIAAANESLLAPELSASEKQARIDARTQYLSDLDQRTTNLCEAHGLEPPTEPIGSNSLAALAPTPDEIASRDFDAQDFINEAKRLAATQQETLHEKLEEFDTQSPPKDELSLDDALERGQKFASELVTFAAPTEEEKIAALERVAARTCFEDVTAGTVQDPELQVRTFVTDLLTEGRSMVGRNFSGCDLRGLTFLGQDLREVSFHDANVTNATFINCRLERSVFLRGSCKHTKFIGCDLSQANLAYADLSDSHFENTKISNTTLRGTKFIRSVLAECRLSGLVLEAVKLEKVRFRDCDFKEVFCSDLHGKEQDWSDSRFEKVTFAKCSLSDAAFRNTEFQECAFNRSSLRLSDWLGAKLKKVLLMDADLQGANLTGAIISECSLRGASLSEAKASQTRFHKSDLSRVTAKNLKAHGAWLHLCILSDGDFANSNFQLCDFYRSIMRCTSMISTKLDGASFYGVDLSLLNYEDASIRNATGAHGDNLKEAA